MFRYLLTYKVGYTLSEAHHSEWRMDKDSRRMASFGWAYYLALCPSLSLSSVPFRCRSCTTWCRSGTAWPPLYPRWCSDWWLSRSCMSKVLLKPAIGSTQSRTPAMLKDNTGPGDQAISPSCNQTSVRSVICQKDFLVPILPKSVGRGGHLPRT